MIYSINGLDCISNKTILFQIPHEKDIHIYKVTDAVFTGFNLFYPNALILDMVYDQMLVPHNEITMSLKTLDSKKTIEFTAHDDYNIVETPVFFFVYNTENYFHFVYDTLPYLISFIELRKSIPKLKLLMNYPNSEKTHFYKFVWELLDILDISNNDVILIDSNSLYRNVYISDSYTHDKNKDTPPHSKIYEFYNNIVNRVISENQNIELPKRVYISRRSWVHGDKSNMGTDYTSRRRLVNEEELVDYLVANGFVEIFTECMSMREKIHLFSQTEGIIGPIGGGLCNALFANKECSLISINSPCFLDVNKRFEHSYNTVTYIPFNDTLHTDDEVYKLYMRVQYEDIVGEITEKRGDLITLSYSNEPVAGWNNTSKYNTVVVNSNKCKKLDNGLNSEWSINMSSFKKTFERCFKTP